MAEMRTRDACIVVRWRGEGGSYKGNSESFEIEDRNTAEQFKLLVEQAGNRWPEGWVPGHGFKTEKEIEANIGTPFLAYANRRIRARRRAEKIGDDTMRRYTMYARTIAGSLIVAPQLFERIEDDEELSQTTLHDPTSAQGLLEQMVGNLPDEDLNEHAAQVSIEDLTAEAITAWVMYMRVRGNKWKTIKNYHGFLYGVMAQAETEGLITRNPCHSTELGKGDARKKVNLTPAQFWVLHSFIHAHYQDFIEAAVGSGIRFGELTAVRVADWHSAERRVRVEEAWKRGPKGKGFFRGKTKTEAGERDVFVGERVAEIFDAHAEGKAPEDLIFTAPRGGRIRQNVFSEEVWGPAVTKAAAQLEEAGLEVRPRFHDLRHTYVHWLRAAKISEKVISGLVGHADEEITTALYGGVPVELIAETGPVIDANLRRLRAV